MKDAEILVLFTNEDQLHFWEFVAPITQIIYSCRKVWFVRKYSELPNLDLSKIKKIIIAGTSLKDSEYLKHLDKFERLKEFGGEILGICAGMQVLGLLFGGKLKKKKEIGFYKENFVKEFLGLKGGQEVYHLHNNYVSLPSEFESFTNSEIPQAIRHKTKPIYGVLFHPEVRQKELLKNFLKS